MPLLIFLLISFFTPNNSYAIDATTLSFQQIKTQDWQLHDVTISLNHIENNASQLQLSIAQLGLPKPFNDLKLFQIQCQKFDWQNSEIHCLKGTAQLQSQLFKSPRFSFSFQITAKQSSFNIQQLKLLEGSFDLQGFIQAKEWNLQLNGKQIGLAVLHQLLFPKLKLTSGAINLNGNAHGNLQGLNKINLQSQIDNLSIQTADGTKATEKLNAELHLQATKNVQKNWLWETTELFQKGNLYIEPLYLENKAIPISLQAQGYWYETKKQVAINSVKFNHPNIGFISANGLLNYQTKFALETANIYLKMNDLAAASEIYLTPFTSATALDGISLAGRLESGVTLKKHTPTNAYLISNHFAITDKKQRIHLENGVMSLNWANQKNIKTSLFSWQNLKLFDIPVNESYFLFLLNQKQISLLKETRVPLLDGQIKIKKFDWEAIKDKSPHVHFSGKVQHISLQKLTEAFKWKALPGKISGQIPSVNFVDGKLSLDGGLKINVFDGEIKINKLAMSGLMSDFSQFYSDIEINHLDLDLLTQQFSFGGMQGGISGFVKNLYMENWQPVTFNAWLGTPEDDDLPHQISQKAVENIASIGGGGIVDFLSRMVLKAFDNFDYEKLGFGCYLQKGVCQLMGVEPADYGYYIVKGGGLPRIDVMGYNPLIDWVVLQERLQRINQSSSDAVVK